MVNGVCNPVIYGVMLDEKQVALGLTRGRGNHDTVFQNSNGINVNSLL
uniref:Uncharacterized protein n=1 Tax=Rhizophora mucronata TaxID=61149 RepID=A0A2P2PG39_RHIMU